MLVNIENNRLSAFLYFKNPFNILNIFYILNHNLLAGFTFTLVFNVILKKGTKKPEKTSSLVF